MELLGRDLVRERLRNALERSARRVNANEPSGKRIYRGVGGAEGGGMIRAIVLAAGKGTRMKSAQPKVLHELCGRPILWYVLRGAARGGHRRHRWS